MPRKNKNARLSKPIKEIKESKAVIVEIDRSKAETMSPGRLVAVAEWRSSQYA